MQVMEGKGSTGENHQTSNPCHPFCLKKTNAMLEKPPITIDNRRS